MKDWITKVTVCAVLLYNLLLGTDYAWASQEASLRVPPHAPQPIVASLASLDNALKEAKKEEFRQFYEIVKDAHKLEGLFALYRRASDDQLYLEVKPEQLNQSYLATVTLESGIGESGIYSGLPLQDFLFYFRPVNDHLQFVIRNVKFRTESGHPEARSLARSFSDSVLYPLKIVGIDPHSQAVLINLNDLLSQDVPGLTSLLKRSLWADYHLDQTLSYLGKVQSFPLNLEVDSIYNFSSRESIDLIALSDSRALTLQVHYSFSQLPENNGYTPRLADDRIGYFITAYQNFSNNNPSDPFVRYINRWNLEPLIPDAPLSPPKKPLVFWIENAVPLEYREAIREGVLMWNKAFEKAGFQNAIEVRQMPDEADWHPADLRYNTIRWFNSVDAFFAKAPARVNPLTGEILDADIIVDANMVLSLQQEYRPLIATNQLTMDGVGFQGSKNPCSSHQNAFEKSVTPGSREDIAANLQQLLADNHLCYGMESAHQASMGSLALSLLQSTPPSLDQRKEYVHQYLRSLIAHEVGHALGLRHNFQGSTLLSPQELNNREVTQKKGLVSSVMDYLPVNLAPPGFEQGDYFPAVVGPYDEWAIAYGYKPSDENINSAIFSEEKPHFLEKIPFELSQAELAYATDEDIWDINPDANVWDLSSDVLLYSQWQLDNARLMWQNLDRRYPWGDESYSNLRLLFNQILNYYFINAHLLTQYIGGQSFRRHPTDAANHWAFTPVSLEKQQQALTELQEYVFAKDAFNFSPQLLNRLAPSRWNHWGNPIPVSRLDYPIHERILRFQSGILRSLLDGDRLHRLRDIELKTLPGQALTIPELFDTLQNGIWTEVLSQPEPQPISSIRRSLQREHLNILLDMVLRKTDVPEDGRTLAWYELRQLQKVLQTRLKKSGETLDLYTKAHLEETSDRIAKALNASLQSG